MRMGEIIKKDGMAVDIGIFGGSAIALKWEFRNSTRDVDIVISGDHGYLRGVASTVAKETGLPDDWMNDAVKGFVSDHGEMDGYAEFVNSEHRGLRVFVPTAKYLLAMKCMAMRIDDPEGHDVTDIKNLIGIAEISSGDELCELVESFYPKRMIQQKVYYGIQRIMEEIGESKPPRISG